MNPNHVERHAILLHKYLNLGLSSQDAVSVAVALLGITMRRLHAETPFSPADFSTAWARYGTQVMTDLFTEAQ